MNMSNIKALSRSSSARMDRCCEYVIKDPLAVGFAERSWLLSTWDTLLLSWLVEALDTAGFELGTLRIGTSSSSWLSSSLEPLVGFLCTVSPFMLSFIIPVCGVTTGSSRSAHSRVCFGVKVPAFRSREPLLRSDIGVEDSSLALFRDAV